MSYLYPIDPIDSFDPSTLINPVETSFIANEYDGEHKLPPFDPSDDPLRQFIQFRIHRFSNT
jgi:hypothetical protein